MALTLIDFDGTGIVAYADGETTDTGGGSWGELGAGTVGDNPDVYLYGSNSYASKYASKVGKTYYQDNGTVSYTANPDELVYMFVNIQSNGQFSAYNTGTRLGSFNAFVGSTTTDLWHWNVANKGDSDGWAGGWKCIVIDPNLTTPAEQEGTPNLASVNTYGVWIDTDVSVRADSIFQSMIVSAKGLYFTGTPTTNAWDELAFWATDYANRAAGVLETRGSTIFMKGAITVGDGSTATTFTANGNVIECEKSTCYNGTAWVSSYSATANNVVTTTNSSIAWTNVSIAGADTNKLGIDTSVGNASSFNGGAIKLLRALTVKATDTFDGVVFSTNDALNLGAAAYDNCAFVNCGTQTVSSTASFSNNTARPPAGTTAFICSDVDQIVGGTITSGGSGYGVEVTTAAGGSWTTNMVGYDAGSTGTNVQKVVGVDATGNEAIFINAASGTVVIATDGVSPPSVAVPAGSTCTVEVSGFKPTLTLTGIKADSAANIAGGAPSSEVRIYAAGTTTEVAGIENVIETIPGSKIGTFAYQYTYSAGTFVDIVVHHYDYKHYRVENYELGAQNGSLPIAQTIDRNYSNP